MKGATSFPRGTCCDSERQCASAKKECQQLSGNRDTDGQNARAKAADAVVRGVQCTRLHLDDCFGTVHHSVLPLCPENPSGLHRRCV